MTPSRRMAGVACALGALGWSSPGTAACASPTGCGCTVSASGVSFGPYDPQRPSPTDSVGTITMDCTSDGAGQSTYAIALSPGSSGNAAQRTLRSPRSVLNYNLYSDPGRGVVWGADSGGGSSVVASFGAGQQSQTFSIYGRIPARQNVFPGSYQDAITITVIY